MYKTSGPLELLPAAHWLVAPEEACSRLEALPPFELLRRLRDGRIEAVPVQCIDFHNLTSLHKRWYHVVEEAVLRDDAGRETIDLCPSCLKGYTAHDGPDIDPLEHGEENDRFDDLYCPLAPLNSIGGGHDYGTFKKLTELSVVHATTTLERLVLARGRCYQVTVKVVGRGQTPREKLVGHTIIFPHNVEALLPANEPFGALAVAAAMSNVRILLVGPENVQTRLEKEVLRIDDLQLHPETIYNHLKIIEHLQVQAHLTCRTPQDSFHQPHAKRL